MGHATLDRALAQFHLWEVLSPRSRSGLPGRRLGPHQDQQLDELHTSGDQKLQIQAQSLESYSKALQAGLQYEQERFTARAAIVEAEAKSEHRLTSTWRPVVMLVFTALVVCDQMGVLVFRLAVQAWILLQVGLSGYVVGRSVEKVAAPLIDDVDKLLRRRTIMEALQ